MEIIEVVVRRHRQLDGRNDTMELKARVDEGEDTLDVIDHLDFIIKSRLFTPNPREFEGLIPEAANDTAAADVKTKQTGRDFLVDQLNKSGIPAAVAAAKAEAKPTRGRTAKAKDEQAVVPVETVQPVVQPQTDGNTAIDFSALIPGAQPKEEAKVDVAKLNVPLYQHPDITLIEHSLKEQQKPVEVAKVETPAVAELTAAEVASQVNKAIADGIVDVDAVRGKMKEFGAAAYRQLSQEGLVAVLALAAKPVDTGIPL